MFSTIINIIAPVFLVIGAGWMLVRFGLFSDSLIDGLMKFAIQFAVPCLLFKATSSLDLATAFDWRLLSSFYFSATVSFLVASFVSWKIFRHEPGTAVAIGFGALFSNSVLLGIPISERTWGSDQIEPVFAIISLHAPFCYLLGISSMELLRSAVKPGRNLPRVVLKAMFSNSLMLGIGLGFMVNISGINIPIMLISAVDMISNAALPAALFGLGGVLTRYRLIDTLSEVSVIALISLFVHPALTYAVCQLLDVAESTGRMAVLVAAMAPGLNSYLFAKLYQRGQETAASLVLLGTLVSIFSVSIWIWLLR